MLSKNNTLDIPPNSAERAMEMTFQKAGVIAPTYTVFCTHAPCATSIKEGVALVSVLTNHSARLDACRDRCLTSRVRVRRWHPNHRVYNKPIRYRHHKRVPISFMFLDSYLDSYFTFEMVSN
jgi:hypothetical protein